MRGDGGTSTAILRRQGVRGGAWGGGRDAATWNTSGCADVSQHAGASSSPDADAVNVDNTGYASPTGPVGRRDPEPPGRPRLLLRGEVICQGRRGVGATEHWACRFRSPPTPSCATSPKRCDRLQGRFDRPGPPTAAGQRDSPPEPLTNDESSTPPRHTPKLPPPNGRIPRERPPG